MTIKLGMVMDSIDQININKDTSFAMLLEAQARGWELYYMELGDLYLNDGIAHARAREITVQRDHQQWYQVTDEKDMPLAELDTIIMRKDPPFDKEFLYATYLLEQAEKLGVYVVNKPQSLRDANEKLFTAWFPQCCAETLVSSEPQRFKQFLGKHKKMILKPLDGMGGASIFYVCEGDSNLNVILEMMTDYSSRYIMAQRYIPEIKRGDKRILLVNGEPIAYALARIPAKGESRGNLAAGGHAKGQELSDRDRWIAEQVGPTLRKKGLVFVGIDVIGDYLTEINVTSPTCVQELDKQFDLNISGTLMDHIEQTLKEA
ncbi:MAG: glutathione synthase [Methylococcales bacterium]|nr:glutathione synthase [Methylococcales bacterium]